jgi:hypothetical protein
MAKPTPAEYKDLATRTRQYYPTPQGLDLAYRLDTFAESIGPTPPPPPIDPIFRVINKTYQQVFNHAVEGTQGWWSDVEVNVSPVKIDCIVVPFVAPANRQCSVKSSNLSIYGVAAICESVGGFTRETGWKLGAPSDVGLEWTTVAGKRGMYLTPGQTYYLHLTSFDIPHFRNTGTIKPLMTGLVWDKYMSQATPV